MGRFVASQTSLHQNALTFGRAGRVVGIAWRKTAAITGGQIELQFNLSGTGSGDTVVLDSGSGNTGVATLSSPVTFTAAQTSGINIASPAGLNPSGSIDVGAALVVEWEPIA
jgi:hypothetical protein